MAAVRKAVAGKPGKLTASYNKVKEFHGQHYTGMQIGRTHRWHYDQGDWKEKKITPDKWEFTYTTVKRRAGKAPEGSGVPVGTGYHWFMLAHQHVEKLNANDYITHLAGLKFKLSHKRSGNPAWNVPDQTQRQKLITILRSVIAELEKEPQQLTPIPLELEYKNQLYTGTAIPILTACEEGFCYNLDIALNEKYYGIMRYTPNGWKISEIKSQGLVNAIGDRIMDWYSRAPGTVSV